jgi:hypothetical protein
MAIEQPSVINQDESDSLLSSRSASKHRCATACQHLLFFTFLPAGAAHVCHGH